MMIGDNNRIVITDLGSVSKARVTVTSRKEALALQELAAVQCTSPYRAPELFEVAFPRIFYFPTFFLHCLSGTLTWKPGDRDNPHNNKWSSCRAAHLGLMKRVIRKNPIYYCEKYSYTVLF